MATKKKKPVVAKKKGGRPKKSKAGQVMNRKTGKFRTGRPTKITDEVIRKLKEAFSWDCTIAQACNHSEISTTTYYEYLKTNPEFADVALMLRDSTTIAAKRNVAMSIKGHRNPITNAIVMPDKHDSKWLLERKEKQTYSIRNELTGQDGDALGVKEITDEKAEEIANAVLDSLKLEPDNG